MTIDALATAIEDAVNDPDRLRHLRREVSAAPLDARDRSVLLGRIGMYVAGCCPEPVEFYPE